MNRTLYALFVALIILLLFIFAYNFYNDPGEEIPEQEIPAQQNSQMLQTEDNVSVETANVDYFENVQGYYVSPEQEGDYPGVVMIHEWWGLNDNIRSMARSLAQEGYNVLAVDLFGEVATTREEAQALTGALNEEEAINNLQAAVDYLQNKNSSKIASLGWCFGGGQSLQLSLSENLDATVIYYGQLVTDRTQLDRINWPVLGIFGDQDTSIPVASVREFETALDQLEIENDIYVYPGVGHAFANPSGDNYAPNETRDAWEKTLSFLHATLKGDQTLSLSF